MHYYILANVTSKIHTHIAKIEIAKINGLDALFRLMWLMMILFAKFKYAKNANKLLKVKFGKYSHSLKFHDIR